MKNFTRRLTGLAVILMSGRGLAQTVPAPPLAGAAEVGPPAVLRAAAAAPPPPSAAPPPPPPDVPPPPAPAAVDSDWKFAFHGVAGVSFYVQDTPTFVLNGQGPLLPLTQPGGGLTTGADIRQSRFSLSMSGPRVFGAVPKALLEIDLFGLNSPGGYGEVSVYSRVRLAYAEMKWENDLLRLGQDHNLILGLLPESIGHLAYPATYFNGMIGWREPGAGYFHTIPFDSSKLELALQINKSDWQNPADFGTSTVQDLNVDYGQLSGYPGIEARVKFTSEHATAYVAAHFNHVGGGRASALLVPPAPAVTRDWDVVAGVAGVKLTAFSATLLANVYVGKNLGPLLGDLLQFPGTNDINEWGGWAQLGYDVTSHLNVWLVGGLARPSTGDLEASGAGNAMFTARSEDSMVGAMVRYQQSGFAFGPEFYHVVAKAITATGAGAPSGAGAPGGVIYANQFMMSGMYFF